MTTGIRCFHVKTDQDHTYGAAATNKRDAMMMVQERLTFEGNGDRPASATDVGPWDAEYGTTLWY